MDSRQHQICEEIRKRTGLPNWAISFTNKKEKVGDRGEIVYEEYVESVKCVLYFWIEDKYISEWNRENIKKKDFFNFFNLMSD